MPPPKHEIPVSNSELRRTLTKLFDRVIDAIDAAESNMYHLTALTLDLQKTRALCLKNLPPDPSVAETILPGMEAVNTAIDLACSHANAPIGCAELAKSACWNAIWERLTRLT